MSVGCISVVIKCIMIYPDDSHVLLGAYDWMFEKCYGKDKMKRLEWLSCGLDYYKMVKLHAGIFWILAICSCALFVPEITTLMNYIGVVTTFLTFIMPGLMMVFAARRKILHRLLQKKCPYFRITKLTMSTGVFYVFYGLFALSLCLAMAVLWDKWE